MKKMIMFVAVALMATFTQAAYVNWGASGLSDYKNQKFYVFDSSKSSDVLATLAAVDDSTAKTLDDMSITSGSVTSKGKASVTNTDVGSTTEFMVVVFAGEIADGTGFKYITEDISSALYTPPQSAPAAFTSTLATAGTVGTMVKAGGGGDVPEPTSGLLLLVGGAMLALRRKQK